MATAALIPVREYLETTYRPDRDYVDGELKERNVGEQPHAHLQVIIGAIFRENRNAWRVRPLTEQRLQVTPTRFRIPDICVIRIDDSKSPIISFPPLLCVEVLSKDDTLSELQERVDDYAAMGVETIWAIDPWKRIGYHASARGFEQPSDGVLKIAGTDVAMRLNDLFSEMDES